MKSGGSLGMKSVKAGYDKNPGVTRADIIKVNNQIREVVTIDSGTLLTVNAPFEYGDNS